MSAITEDSPPTSDDDRYFFGFDLLMKTIERDLRVETDLLVALAHFLLIKHFHMRCLSIGEDKTLSESETEEGSEILPPGWNDNSNKYTLRYVREKNLYLLISYRSGNFFILHLWRSNDAEVSNVVLLPHKEVRQLKGNSIYDMLPKARALADTICSSVIYPILGNGNCERQQRSNSTVLHRSNSADTYVRTYPFDYYPHPAARSVSQFPFISGGEYQSVSPVSSGNVAASEGPPTPTPRPFPRNPETGRDYFS